MCSAIEIDEALLAEARQLAGAHLHRGAAGHAAGEDRDEVTGGGSDRPAYPPAAVRHEHGRRPVDPVDRQGRRRPGADSVPSVRTD
jgi:hypothetical protein